MLKRSEGRRPRFLVAAIAALALASCRDDSGKATDETKNPATAETSSASIAETSPAPGGPLRVRKEWHSLSPDEKAAYAAGVKLMLSRSETMPTSWLYQANIHGIPANDSPCEPPSVLKQPSWDTCQHGNFFFLPWHRIYLYYFEQILQAAIREATGKPDYVFNLPYWDYENADYHKLPEEFRVPAESSNSLYVTQRAKKCNDGEDCVIASEASAVEALQRRPFCNCPDGSTCPGCTANLSSRQAFGSQFAPPSERAFGELESQPHNVVHPVIGGRKGWMSTTKCAARDPIFWLHHANIDRLWQVWLNQGNRQNPLGADNWRTEIFTFFDAQGNPVKKTGCEILNMATQLGYEYDGVPVNNVELCPPPTAAAPAVEPPAPQPTTLVALALREIRLSDAAVHVSIPVPAQAAGRLRSLVAGRTKHAWLVVEGLKQLKEGAYYQVYVNLPEGQKPDPQGPHFVGNISLFGASHHGAGATESAFDITDELQDLRARNLWSGDVRVTFVLGNPEGRAAAVAAQFMSFRRIVIEEH